MNNIKRGYKRINEVLIMVKCSDCKYYSWDWFDDGEEFRSCLYWFFTKTNIYPALENNNP